MIITLNGQEREVKFTLNMINELDKKYVMDAGGAKFAMGLNLAFTYLSQKNPVAIANVLKACFPKTPEQHIEQYVEDYAVEHETLEPLFAEIIEEMGKHPLLTATLDNFKQKARVETTDEG